MKHPVSVLLASAAGAVAWSPFRVTTMLAHQPNGNSGGNVNFYRIAFDVYSENSGGTKHGFCQQPWADNSRNDPETYSLYVPTDQWIQCDSAENTYDGNSVFQFKLFPYFSIGNYSVEVKEDLSGSSITGFRDFRNDSSAFQCWVNPIEVEYLQHASGECYIPDARYPLEIPIS